MRSRLPAVTIVFLIVAGFHGPGARGQEPAASETAPLLTLDHAVEIAIANNPSLQITSLQINVSKFDLAATKTKRLPAISTYLFSSVLITPLSFTIPAGSLGTYQATGPIPAKDKSITTDAGTVNTYAVGSASEPLLQQYQLHLSIREKELTTEINNQKYRAARQNLVDQVKQAYYSILQSESAVRVIEASIKQYEELDRVMLVKISQQTVLQSGSLEVKAELAQQRYKLLQENNDLQTRKENLNYLLGRDIETAFSTEDVPAISPTESDLKLAQQTALAQRPEIKQAELTVEQADYDRRLAKAQYIPDLSLSVHYISPFNVQFLPKNLASAGFEFNWEPWDWGRRKDQINEKKIALDQSRLQLRDTQSKVLLDVNNRFRKLQENRVLLTVAQSAQLAATEKLREYMQKFDQQSVLLTDVLQQQAALATANDNYEQALLAFWTSKAEFEKALGEE